MGDRRPPAALARFERTSMIDHSAVILANRPGNARTRLALVAAAAAGLLLGGCGIVANNKAIASGTPTAAMHFGPMHKGMMVQSINIHDGASCRGQNFARFKTIGAYLGSDVDLDVPAGGEMFFSLYNSWSGACKQGFCTFRCGAEASFAPQAGEHYVASVVFEGPKCAISMVLKRDGKEVPVATRPAPPC